MKRWLTSVGNGLRGIGFALKTQRNFRIQLASAIAVVLAGFWLKISTGEWLAIALASGLVMTAELLNTGLEALADTLHPERAKGIGRAKDAAAGGVLLSSAVAGVVGLIVFGPKLWEIFFTIE
jgi:diacylglycerol kinase (ATP)